MMLKNQGFTLVELIMVIVILGILAAVAIPNFVDLSTVAKQNALNSVAAALSSANSINYGSRKASASLGVPITNCTDMGNALQGGLPTGYAITAAAVAVNTTVTCSVNYSPVVSGVTAASFSATGIT